MTRLSGAAIKNLQSSGSSSPSRLFQALFLILIWSLMLLVRLPLIFLKGFEICGPEVAIFGLMGKHILEGKWMVFVYGQNYTGALEGYLSALFFLIRGIDITSVYFASALVYGMFLTAHYILIRKAFGWKPAFLSGLWLAVSPWQLTWNSIYTNGGYVGAMFFGSLFLFMILRKSKFLAGFFLGLAIWTQNVGFLYALTIGIYGMIQDPEAFHRIRKNFWPFLSGRLIKLSFFARTGFQTLHALIAAYFLLCFLALFTQSTKFMIGDFLLPLPTTPFYLAKVRMIVMALAVEGFLLFYLSQGPKIFSDKMRKNLGLFVGFFLGILPSIIYALSGRPYGSYERFSDIGMVRWEDFFPHFGYLIQEGFIHGFFGVVQNAGSQPAAGKIASVTGLILSLFFLSWFVGTYLSQWKNLKTKSASSGEPFTQRHLFPLVFFLLYLALYLVTDARAERYFVPMYQAVAVMFAFAVVSWRERFGKIIYLSFGLLLAAQLANNYFYIQNIPDQTAARKEYAQVIGEFKSRGIQGGYAENQRIATQLTFFSQEALQVVNYDIRAEIYRPHNDFVKSLPEVIGVFQKSSARTLHFEAALKRVQVKYQKKDFDQWVLFYISQSEKFLKEILSR